MVVVVFVVVVVDGGVVVVVVVLAVVVVVQPILTRNVFTLFIFAIASFIFSIESLITFCWTAMILAVFSMAAVTCFFTVFRAVTSLAEQPMVLGSTSIIASPMLEAVSNPATVSNAISEFIFSTKDWNDAQVAGTVNTGIPVVASRFTLPAPDAAFTTSSILSPTASALAAVS